MANDQDISDQARINAQVAQALAKIIARLDWLEAAVRPFVRGAETLRQTFQNRGTGY